MFFKNTKKKLSFITLSLCLGAILLTGIGYAFVQYLDKMYRAQAQDTLTTAAAGIAHHLHTHLVDYQNYVDMLVKTFEQNSELQKKSLEAGLHNLRKRSDLFPFMGIITADKQAHTVSKTGFIIHIDNTTIDKLLLVPKVIPIHASVQVNGKDEDFIFFTSAVTLSSGEKGLFFTGRRHGTLQEALLPKGLQDSILYAIIDAQGSVLESTFPSINAGENLLREWAMAPENSTELMHDIGRTIAVAKPTFTTIYYQGESHFVNFAPTQEKNWSVVASISKDTLEAPLERIIFLLIATGVAWSIFCVIALFQFIKIQNNEKSATKFYAKRLQWLFDEVPAGVVRFKDDAEWTILEYGDSFLRSLGISKKELQEDYQQRWNNLIHPDDRTRVHHAMDAALQEGEEIIVLEYRVQTLQGTVTWILETARIMSDADGRWFWSIITNITERKKKEMREQNMSERYRYLFESSENILYEYNWNTQKLYTTKQFFKKFGYTLPVATADYYPVDDDIIHPDDMDLFHSMHAKLKAGGSSSEALVRIKNASDAWIWCQLRQGVWVDMNDSTTKAIGEIKNVDEETRNLLKLREDVQRDPFTGLYNKTASAELIEREIMLSQDKRGVLCIIDVDNFKQVNDNLGHAVGDIVIKNLANGLASIFRSDDIVGRMGGDEYIVYIKNMPNLGILLVKLDKVLDFFRQTLEGEGVKVKISCSVGIALYPSDASSYEELYVRADKALYRSKKKKGIYTFYDSKIDH